MKITVSHIYGPAIKKMVAAGWKIHNSPLHHSVMSQAEYRRVSGCEMEGEFPTIGDAIRDFDKNMDSNVGKVPCL